jgi:hypothetical protein
MKNSQIFMIGFCLTSLGITLNAATTCVMPNNAGGFMSGGAPQMGPGGMNPYGGQQGMRQQSMGQLGMTGQSWGHSGQPGMIQQGMGMVFADENEQCPPGMVPAGSMNHMSRSQMHPGAQQWDQQADQRGKQRNARQGMQSNRNHNTRPSNQRGVHSRNQGTKPGNRGMRPGNNSNLRNTRTHSNNRPGVSVRNQGRSSGNNPNLRNTNARPHNRPGISARNQGIRSSGQGMGRKMNRANQRNAQVLCQPGSDQSEMRRQNHGMMGPNGPFWQPNQPGMQPMPWMMPQGQGGMRPDMQPAMMPQRPGMGPNPLGQPGNTREAAVTENGVQVIYADPSKETPVIIRPENQANNEDASSVGEEPTTIPGRIKAKIKSVFKGRGIVGVKDQPTANPKANLKVNTTGKASNNAALADKQAKKAADAQATNAKKNAANAAKQAKEAAAAQAAYAKKNAANAAASAVSTGFDNAMGGMKSALGSWSPW